MLTTKQQPPLIEVQPIASEGPRHDEDVLSVAGRYWLFILLCLLLGIGAGVVNTLTQARQYEASGSIFVTSSLGLTLPGANADTLSLTSALGGAPTRRDYIKAILSSSSLKLQVADDLKLQNSETFWKRSGVEPARRTRDRLLEEMDETVSVVDKQGLLRLQARTLDATLSANIIADYLLRLSERLSTENNTKTQFLAGQLKKTTVELKKAEEALRIFQEKSDLSLAQEEQARAEALALVDLQKQLITSEAALSGLNEQLQGPGDVQKQIELRSNRMGLEAQTRTLRRMVEERERRLQALPALTATYSRLLRNVKVQEKVHQLLTEQYNLALIQESGQEVNYKVVDRPLEPQDPLPRRGLVRVSLGAAAGLLVGVQIALLLHRLRRPRTRATGA